MKTRWLMMVLLLAMIGCTQKAAAQKDSMPLISIHVADASIEQLAVAIEKQINLHIYYDPSQFDSLLFSIDKDNQPLDKILEQLLKPLNIQFSIVEPGYVFINKGKPINTTITGKAFTD